MDRYCVNIEATREVQGCWISWTVWFISPLCHWTDFPHCGTGWIFPTVARVDFPHCGARWKNWGSWEVWLEAASKLGHWVKYAKSAGFFDFLIQSEEKKRMNIKFQFVHQPLQIICWILLNAWLLLWESSCMIFSYGLLCVFFSSKWRAEEWRRVASYFECIRKLAAALCLSFCLHLFKTFDVKEGEEKATFLKSSSGNVGPCNATTHILRNWILTESFAPQVSTSYGVKKRSNYKQGYFHFEEITLKSAY